MDHHGFPYPLNRYLKFALNLNKSNIYICIVSSGRHTGTCIIFVYGGKLYCITYGVNVYYNKVLKGQYIAVRTPEYILVSFPYSIIMWKKITKKDLAYITYIYSMSFYIRPDTNGENIVETNLPYAIVPFNAGHNCQSFAARAVGDIDIRDFFSADGSDLGRTIFQQCMHAPNTFFYMCIKPLVDLIVLAVTHGIFSETASYRSIFEEVIKHSVERRETVEDGSPTVTFEKRFVHNIIVDIENALLEIERALIQHPIQSQTRNQAQKPARSVSKAQKLTHGTTQSLNRKPSTKTHTWSKKKVLTRNQAQKLTHGTRQSRTQPNHKNPHEV
jgi:hypothetical protein